MKFNGNSRVRALFAAVMCACLGDSKNTTQKSASPADSNLVRRRVRPGSTSYFSAEHPNRNPDRPLRNLLRAAVLTAFGMGLMQAQASQQPMGVGTAAGTIISISNNTPPTFDSTGYSSSNMVWNAIGEIVDGGEHGRTYASVTHKAMARRGIQKFKGSYDEGQKTLQLGIDRDDVGQAMCTVARNSDSDYYFKVAYPSGDIDYFAGKVMKFTTKTSGVDTIVDGSITIDITTSSTGVGVIEVNAP